MKIWVQGVSTRKVDALVAAIDSDASISRLKVSRTCKGLDEQIQAFLERPLDGSSHPYLYLDATDLYSESESVWQEFLASFKQNELAGVRLVVSDAHPARTCWRFAASQSANGASCGAPTCWRPQ